MLILIEDFTGEDENEVEDEDEDEGEGEDISKGVVESLLNAPTMTGWFHWSTETNVH